MILESKLLKGMLAAAPENEVRYYPNGVHVAKGILEVTNGHYLFRAKVDTAKEERLFTLVGSIPARAYTTELNFDHKFAMHQDAQGKIIGASYIREIDGKFPACDMVVNDFVVSDVSEIGFNSQYLGLPFKLFKASGAKLEFSGDGKVARATFKTTDLGDVEMYLMPMISKTG